MMDCAAIVPNGTARVATKANRRTSLDTHCSSEKGGLRIRVGLRVDKREVGGHHHRTTPQHGPRMPMLHDPEVRRSIEARLEAIRADSPRQWGSMSVDQMLWHVNQFLAAALGEG